MSGEQHIDKAVTKLRSYINANIATKLRAVETAQSLTTNSLTDPVAVLDHRAPFDNRSPLIEVFEESWRFVDQRQGLVSVDATIAVKYITDADISAAENFMRRYMSAVIETIRADSTLGNTVVDCLLTDGSSAVGRGDTSTTLLVSTQGVDVHVFEGVN